MHAFIVLQGKWHHSLRRPATYGQPDYYSAF